MNIPNLVSEMLTEDGKQNPNHKQMMEQLIMALQHVISDEGIRTPKQTATNIAALNNQNSIGALVYDNENHKLMVNINGTFKTVTVS